MKSITLALVLCLSSQFSLAKDINGRYTAVGIGNHSCGKIIYADKLGDLENWESYNLYTQWMSGYLTAYNRFTPNTYTIFSTDDDAAWAYIVKYCKENPLDEYVTAIIALTNELYPARIKKDPAD